MHEYPISIEMLNQPALSLTGYCTNQIWITSSTANLALRVIQYQWLQWSQPKYNSHNQCQTWHKEPPTAMVA